MRRATLLIVSFTLVAASPASAATFLVNTNADSGAGSLREAITAANSTSGDDTISFAGLAANERVISLTSAPLPAITRRDLTIDGTTFPGFPTARVFLDGSGLAGDDNNGLAFLGYVGAPDGGVVEGLQIGGFSGAGIRSDVSAVTIIDNLIGTNGTTATPNDGAGVDLRGVQDTVGGTTAGAGNVISGNTGPGVLIASSFAGNHSVYGNVIGLNVAQNAALPNGGGGVLVQDGADSNRIGTGAPGSAGGNVIAGNSLFGVRIAPGPSSSNRVQGNLIGLNGNGTAFPNPLGIDIGAGAFNTTIGGLGNVNVVSGNSGDAIRIGGDNTGLGENLIGTDLAGTGGVPNTGDGIAQLSGSDSLVGANGVPTVAFNGGDGFHVSGGTARIFGGVFRNNGGSGLLTTGAGRILSVRDVLVRSNGGYGGNLIAPVTIHNTTADFNGVDRVTVQFFTNRFTAEQKLAADRKSVTVDVTGATPNSTFSVEAGTNPGCGNSFYPIPGSFATGTTDATGNAQVTAPIDPAATDPVTVIATDSAQGSAMLEGCAGAGQPPTPRVADLAASFDPNPRVFFDHSLFVSHNVFSQILVVTNRGPSDSPGGKVRVNFPLNTVAPTVTGPGVSNVTVERVVPNELSPGESYAVVTLDLGPIPAGQSVNLNVDWKMSWGDLYWKVPLTLETTAVVTGTDDPSQETTGQAFNISDPGALFSRSHFLNLGKDFTVLSGSAKTNGPKVPRTQSSAAAHDPAALTRVVKVEVALVRLTGGARAAAARGCDYVRNKRGRLRHKRAKKGECGDLRWLKAKLKTRGGRYSWKLRLGDRLPAGKWVAYVRATNAAGIFGQGEHSDVFSVKRGNMRRFTVERPRASR